MTPSTTRHSFAAGLATVLGSSRILGANGRIGISFIGVGNRGDQLHDAFLEDADNQTVALCDLRDGCMEHAIQTIDACRAGGNTTATLKQGICRRRRPSSRTWPCC